MCDAGVRDVSRRGMRVWPRGLSGKSDRLGTGMWVPVSCTPAALVGFACMWNASGMPDTRPKFACRGLQIGRRPARGLPWSCIRTRVAIEAPRTPATGNLQKLGAQQARSPATVRRRRSRNASCDSIGAAVWGPGSSPTSRRHCPAATTHKADTDTAPLTHKEQPRLGALTIDLSSLHRRATCATQADTI